MLFFCPYSPECDFGKALGTKVQAILTFLLKQIPGLVIPAELRILMIMCYRASSSVV